MNGVRLTGDTDAVDVVGDHALGLDDLVELRSSAVQHNGVEPDARQKAEAERKFVELLEHRTADLDDCKLGGVGGVGRGTEYPQVPLDLAFGADRVEQAGDSVLQPVSLAR